MAAADASAPLAPRRRMRAWLIGLLVVLLTLPLAGYGALLLLLNSDAVRPRVEAAVRGATGREFSLSGPVGLRASLVPAITLEGPVLANAPGGSRPDMLHARRIEAEVALLPLLSHRVEVRRLTIVGADLLLEVDAEGHGNWQFARAAKAETAPAPAPSAPPPRPLDLDVATVAVEAGRVTWRAGGREEVVELPRLLLRGSAGGILAEGEVVARGVTATVNGTSGPLAALLGDAASDWPFRLGLSGPGLNAETNGSLPLPFRGAWRARVAATADTAARLAPALPGVALPDARGLSLVAEAEAGTGLRSLHVSLNEVALRAGGREITAGPLQFTAASVEAPVTLGGSLRSGGLAVNFGVQGPTLAQVLAEGAGPLAISLEGEGVAGTLHGALAPGRTLAETDWAFSLRVPDLRALGQRAGLGGLPGLHDAAFDGRAHVLGEGVDLPEFVLASREVAGRASFGWRAGPVPSALLRAVMERVDADALRLQPPAPAPAANPVPAPAAPAAPPSPAPAVGRPNGRVIPDQPVDLSVVRDAAFNLDAEGTVASLRSGGADWRDVSLRAVLNGRKLVGERFSAQTPGGPVAGSFSLEADGAVPRVFLALRSGEGGVDAAPLLQALGLSSPVSGPAALDLSLSGQGAGTRALAASLSGHVGLAMTGGHIDQRLLAGATAALRGVVPGEALGGATELRCLALRFDLAAGVAQSRALLLETRVASATGAGAANLGDETLAFRLRPVVRVGDLSVTTPLGVTGRFAAPRFSVDPNAAAAAAAGVLGGLARRSDDADTAALGALAEGLLGGRGAAAAAPDCAAQLAVARGEAPAVGVAPAAPTPRAREPRVQDLLRGLLGR
ncbi:AsmA family protein [Muricoccus aerilatus]|uniref:AsmA family protein n=1 Tax=Muricoccus aerilatus TaxID=452982 RepID=UPI0005C142F0|nr:AsmA family protein [Roseomonas aerilata]